MLPVERLSDADRSTPGIHRSAHQMACSAHMCCAHVDSSVDCFPYSTGRHTLHEGHIAVIDVILCLVPKDGAVRCIEQVSDHHAVPHEVDVVDESRLRSYRDVVSSVSLGCATVSGGTPECWGQWSAQHASPRGGRAALPSALDPDSQSSAVPDVLGAVGLQVSLGRVCGVRRGRVVCSAPPILAREQSEVAEIAFTPYRDCILNTAGEVYCRQQLGARYAAYKPVSVPGVSTSIGASYVRACALTEAGEVYCWGRAFAGEPEARVPGAGPLRRVATNVEQLAVKTSFICVWANDRMFPSCWGYGESGRRVEWPGYEMGTM